MQVPEDLKNLYGRAISSRHDFGSQPFAGPATVEVLIERIAQNEAELATLRSENKEAAKILEYVSHLSAETFSPWHSAILMSRKFVDKRSTQAAQKGSE